MSSVANDPGQLERARFFPAAPKTHVNLASSWLAAILRHPAAVFALASIAFGIPLIASTPPMRGPDEPAHFVRAYALAGGDIVPSAVDKMGRKGAFIPLRLQREMEVFERAHQRTGDAVLPYADVFANYRAVRRAMAGSPDAGQPTFNLYGGSEAYSPIPYLPYWPAAAAARVLGLDFLSTLYLMRLVGFALLTACTAWAIALVPRLQWVFLAIALLPSALYGRAVISADGAGLTAVMMVTALGLRRLFAPAQERLVSNAIATILCVLTKPPQIVFVMLQWPRAAATGSRTRVVLALVVLPAVVLAVGWAAFGASEPALWRIAEPANLQQFDLRWRLGFMVEHPLHFFTLLAGMGEDAAHWPQQLIGVLGWLDCPLRPAVYPTLGILLAMSGCVSLGLAPQARLHVAAMHAATVVAYVAAVLFIFYARWTPLDADHILGVQGRYFVVILPLIAVMAAVQVEKGLPKAVVSASAITCAAVSGLAAIEAVLRVDWMLWS